MNFDKKRHIVALLCLVVFVVFAMGSSNSKNTASNASSQSSSSQVAQEKKSDLEVLEHSTSSEQYSNYVVGTVRNNSNKKYGYVQISINLYDDSGAQVGSTMANLNNLEPGGTWKFKALIMDKRASKYKIDKVTGF